MEEGQYLRIPAVGDAVKGKIISADRREVRIDIDGLTTGVIRGREIFSESAQYDALNVGDEVEATVIDLENENGEMELSFRFAGQKKAWEELRDLFATGKILDVKIVEANKGGLIVRMNHITGFLPVSQLSPDHYPRVTGGDKNKIFEKLKSYVGSTFSVKVIDANEQDEKLIVSEKSVWEERQKSVIAQYRVGTAIEGEVTALADFGAFVRFGSLEGLVHISEIAWQRIDHPRDILKLGQKVEAEIIGIEGSKIFLSMKKMVKDPWSDIQRRYKVGDIVEGTVLKVNPFGFFVELDMEIHGLAHVSELSDKPGTDVNAIAKAGDKMNFKIISIEPNEHRLGLSLKAAAAKAEEKAE
jgi:small subunit ribosomal protein S1